MSKKTVRHLLVNLTVLLVSTAVAVGAAELASRVSFPGWAEFDNSRFMQTVLDPHNSRPFAMGRPGFSGYFAQNDGDFRVRIDINRSGFRNDAPVTAAEGRVWAIGDSFTFGWGVDARDSFASVAARLATSETYNVASPGTDVCGYQSLARQLLSKARPRAVVVGLVIENDLAVYDCDGKVAEDPSAAAPSNRLVSVKLWLTGRSALYNLIAISIKKNPELVRALEAIGVVAVPHVDHRHLVSLDSHRVAASTADEIVRLRDMFPSGTPYAVLVIPSRFELMNHDKPWVERRKAIVRELAGRGIDVIDPTDALDSAGFQAVHFAHDGHWSRYGHEIAGQQMAVWIGRQIATMPAAEKAP